MALNYLQGMAGRFGGRGIDPMRSYAQRLLEAGTDTSPKYVGQGIGQLAKSILGMMMMKRSMGQETDAMKWLTAKMPDKTRQPTETEAYGARPDLEMLLQQSLPTAELTGRIPDIRPEYGPGPTRKLGEFNLEGVFGNEYIGDVDMSTTPTPRPDDWLMQKGVPEVLSTTESDQFARSGSEALYGGPAVVQPRIDIPKTIEELNMMNMIQESPDQTEFTYEGKTRPVTAEDRLKLPGAIDRGSEKFIDQMERAREATTRFRPRDYAEELASGMKAYRTDPTKQISDPYTRMEWLRESAMGKEGNPFVRRMLQNLMFAEMQRDIGKEDLASARGFKTSERLAQEKATASEGALDRESRERAAKEKSLGLDPSNVREWNFYSKLPAPEKEAYLTMKRADKSFNIGPSLVTPSQTDPSVLKGETATGLKPSQELPYIREKTDIEQEGKLSAKYMDDLTRMQPKAASALGSFQAKTEFMRDNMKMAIENISGWSTKFGAMLSGWPGSQSQALAAILQTIKANVGFQALQEMRANSPTGGALGQVSERELAYLQATLGDLAQTQDGAILTKKLKAMMAQIDGMHGRLQSAYDMTFRPLTEAEGGDGNQYTIPFSPGPDSTIKKNRRNGDDPYNLGL